MGFGREKIWIGRTLQNIKLFDAFGWESINTSLGGIGDKTGYYFFKFKNRFFFMTLRRT